MIRPTAPMLRIPAVALAVVLAVTLGGCGSRPSSSPEAKAEVESS